jgi:hypothetical protein
VSGRYAKNLGTDWRTRSQAIGLAAEGLNTRAESYCADVQSDGFVPDAFLGAMCGGKVDKKALSELVAAGWWQRVEGGHLLTHYTQRNGTRAESEARAKKNAARQDRYRERHSDDPNASSNGGSNALRDASPSPSHQSQSPDRSASRSSARATPAGIVEGAFVTALGAKGGSYRPRSGDHEHFRDAAESMKGAGILRETAAAWCADFVEEFTHRTPKNLALYAQSRAANGGAKVTPLRPKRDAWQAPAEADSFAATPITDDLFKRESAS